MQKFYALLVFILMVVSAQSQTYSYSFSGDLNPQNITAYEKECMTFDRVQTVKIKYKTDSQKGEVIIVVKPYPKGTKMEGKQQFKPTDIKSFLISKGLSPMQFREIKK